VRRSMITPCLILSHSLITLAAIVAPYLPGARVISNSMVSQRNGQYELHYLYFAISVKKPLQDRRRDAGMNVRQKLALFR
jgi:hypothetical protein